MTPAGAPPAKSGRIVITPTPAKNMITTISFITGNKGKFEEAQQIFSGSGIELNQQQLDTPEIQSDDTPEIARFSAQFAGSKLNTPLFVMDLGFYIEALNGFPGPFIKFVNKWLSEDQILKLLEGKNNRKAYWITALGLFLPGEEVKIFASKSYGEVPKKISGNRGYMGDKLFRPLESKLVLSEMSETEYNLFWNNSSCWQEMITYLSVPENPVPDGVSAG